MLVAGVSTTGVSTVVTGGGGGGVEVTVTVLGGVDDPPPPQPANIKTDVKAVANFDLYNLYTCIVRLPTNNLSSLARKLTLYIWQACDTVRVFSVMRSGIKIDRKKSGALISPNLFALSR